MRILFFNEGNLGAHVMGQGQLETALRTGLAQEPQVQTRFAGLSPMGRVANALASREIRPFASAGLDFPALRWHIVQSLRARRGLERELEQWPPDVVHVHSHSVSLAMGARTRSVPVVLSVDTTVRDWAQMPAWASKRRSGAFAIAPSCTLERRALRVSPLVLAWSAWTRASIERTAPGARVVEHHPGLDLAHYRPAARVARTRPRVLFVGGRFLEKGGLDLIEALAERLGGEVELDVVTPAAVPERPGVRVHRLEPSDPRLLDLQQQADLFCLPSYGDAVPWAVLEAMACGTPVLATRVGGIPDLLEHGHAGELVPVGDRRALGEALESLLGDPGRRAILGARARERCERHYDARLQFSRLVNHLDDALRGRSPAHQPANPEQAGSSPRTITSLASLPDDDATRASRV